MFRPLLLSAAALLASGCTLVTGNFTDDGAAIHENYWRRPATFGMPGSHGCIGMAPADAAWFWDFSAVGTPLVIHE